MKILSIGNSYSSDAHRYIHRLAAQNGLNAETLNLYIGGCSLERHYGHFLGDLAAYDAIVNGKSSDRKISIREALTSEPYDVVTLQQASYHSFRPDTYFPYIIKLMEAVREACPGAKIYLHETWGYKENSERLHNLGFLSHAEMYASVETGYRKAYALIGADGWIPSGKAVSLLCEKEPNIELFRDDIHMSLAAGRFLLALTWLETLFGISSEKMKFSDFDGEWRECDRDAICRAAHAACVWARPFQNT